MTNISANDEPRARVPADFTWPGGKRLALSIVVNVEEGAEQNIADGDRGPEPVDELSATPRRAMRVYSSESNYRYGIVAGAPRILRLLEDHRIPATWTAAAVALERAPDLAARIVARGDEIASHGHRWVHQYWMDESQERAFIRTARDLIAGLSGRAPAGWLSRYLTTDNTLRLLVEEGFAYHMDDFSDDMPFWKRVPMRAGEERPLLVIPYAMDSNDMKFWLAPGLMPRDWLNYAIDTFEELLAEAKAVGPRMMSLGVHLRIIGRPGRIGALRAFLEHVANHPDVWIAPRLDIGRAYAAAVPPPIAGWASGEA